MRIRLRIERNELPTVSVLWAVGDTEVKQTIAQFLERVDERFPITGGCWGLEDYSISVGGYEVVHYNEIGTVFQHEDEVVIKPLQHAEVRARRVTGREQISHDGRHMLDGVPWGKPLLRRPMRADLNIPPRKMQRLDDGTPLAIEGGDEQANSQALVRFEAADEDDDDEEDDMDFELGEDDDDSVVDSEEDEEDSDDSVLPESRRRSRRSALLDEEAEVEGNDEEDSDDDSSSSDDDSDSDSSDDSSSDSSSDDSSADSDVSSEASWNGISSSAPAETEHTPKSSPASAQIIAELSNSLGAPSGLPFEGKVQTKQRNHRRRDQRRLKYLKELGVVPSSMTLPELADLSQEEQEDLKLQMQKAQAIQKALNSEEAPITESENAYANGDESSSTVLNKAQAALDEVQAMIDNMDTLPRTAQVKAVNGTNSSNTEPEVDTGADDEPPEVEPATLKRKRLDLAGTNRLVFGSLGVRTPKTQAEKDAMQKKLSARAQRNIPASQPALAGPSASQAVEPQQAEEDDDPDTLLARIELSAVECCDEGVTLSAPPFPFEQRWDPQYQWKKNKCNVSGASRPSKKRKMNVNGAAYVETGAAYVEMGAAYVETYDKYNTNGRGDALNYDDEEEEAEDDSYWEDGALLDDGEDDPEPAVVDDGFPALPDDVSALPSLAEVDALKGDYVVFSELAVSAATNWQPVTITRTVRLETKDDDGWSVKIAQRDMPSKEYNDEGQRIYKKFEMEDLSDDEGDEGVKTLQWNEMQEPRLLQRDAKE